MSYKYELSLFIYTLFYLVLLWSCRCNFSNWLLDKPEMRKWMEHILILLLIELIFKYGLLFIKVIDRIYIYIYTYLPTYLPMYIYIPAKVPRAYVLDITVVVRACATMYRPLPSIYSTDTNHRVKECSMSLFYMFIILFCRMW